MVPLNVPFLRVFYDDLEGRMSTPRVWHLFGATPDTHAF